MIATEGPCFRLFPHISTYFRISAWGEGDVCGHKVPVSPKVTICRNMSLLFFIFSPCRHPRQKLICARRKEDL